MSGIPVGQPGFWQLLIAVYGSFMPVVLYATWTALAVWDIAQRSKGGAIRKGPVGLWLGAILLIPFGGVIAYLGLSRSLIPAWIRALVVGGGLGAYALVVLISMGVGGLL